MTDLEKAVAKIRKLRHCPTESELGQLFTKEEIRALAQEHLKETIREVLDHMCRPADPARSGAALGILKRHMGTCPNPEATVGELAARMSDDEREILRAGLPQALRVDGPDEFVHLSHVDARTLVALPR
jgi:hypothetical protein